MFTSLIVLILLICVLLMLIVLAQNPKGGGLSTQFGGAGASQLMGVQRTGDLLEKLTWGFAISLMVLSLAAYVVIGSGSQTAQTRSVNIEKARTAASASPVAAPAAKAPATSTPEATAPATTEPAAATPAEGAAPAETPATTPAE